MQLLLLLLVVVVVSLNDFFCPATVDAVEVEDTAETETSTLVPRRRMESTIPSSEIFLTTSHRDDIQSLVLTIKEWLEHYVVLEPIPIKDVTISGYDKTGSRFHLSPSSLGLVEGRLTAPISNDAPFSDQLTLSGFTSVKGYTKFVYTILNGCSSHPIVGGGCWNENDIISAFQEMASKPLQQGATAASFSSSYSSASTTTTTTDTNTDTGGGSGAGFQIFCYNTAVLSTGGGGGGGVHPDPSSNGSGSSTSRQSNWNDHNSNDGGGDDDDRSNNARKRKVAGIGAGIQIQLGPATTTSFGGGLDYPYTTEISLDRDAADCHSFCQALDNLVPILRQCHREGHLRVEGGGGGGGGVTLINTERNHEERMNNNKFTKSDNGHDNNDNNNGQHVLSQGFGFQFKIFDNN